MAEARTGAPPPPTPPAPDRRARWLAAWSVRAYLTVLVGSVLLPMAALAGLLAYRAADAERSRTRAAVASVTEAARITIERELHGLVETLQTLATSPYLEAEDYGAFQRQAEDVARAVGYAVILRDATGRQLANTLVPWGRPLPEGSSLSGWDPTLLSTRQPVVSDHYVGLTGGRQHSFAVMLPVAPAEEGAEVRWLMHLSVPVARLRDVLAALGQDQPAQMVIADRRGVVVARTQDHEAAVGTPSALAARIAEAPALLSGTTTDRDGRRVFYVGQRSNLAGWYVFSAVDAAIVDGPPRRALWRAALAAAGLVAAALLAAQVLGARLAAGIRDLAAAGAAVEHGEAVRPRPAGILEIDEVGATLATVSLRLQAQAAEREATAERQRLVMHELNHRVKNILASVQALAMLTARGATDVASYRDGLAERLQSLARTQALLTEAMPWQGTTVAQVLRTELGMHDLAASGDAAASGETAPVASRIALEGPAVPLAGHQVLAFGMLVHELATNAAKYGALSVPGGQLSVAWTLRQEGAEGRGGGALDLVWTETGGPPVTAPARRGFGTEMIERGLARQLSARVRSEWRPEGLRFSLAMPLPGDAAAAAGAAAE